MSVLKKIFIVVILILEGILTWRVVTLNSQLYKARHDCIEMNRQYNDLFDVVAKQYFLGGDNEWRIAFGCLQEMTKTMLPVNEALGIDCTVYNDNGEPIYVEKEDGTKTTSQRIPNELRLVKH